MIKHDNMRLSIIIPYYNALEYIKRLMRVLEPQLTSEVEVIIVDDGCNESELDSFKARVIHLPENSGGASIPRNKGLDVCEGKYVTFVDTDDLVSSDYVSTILNKTHEDWDYCLFSWKMRDVNIIIKDEPPKWNHSVWNCVYKRDLIGDNRFPPLRIGEDWEFNDLVRHGKKANIEKVLYEYNCDNKESITYGWK